MLLRRGMIGLLVLKLEVPQLFRVLALNWLPAELR